MLKGRFSRHAQTCPIRLLLPRAAATSLPRGSASLRRGPLSLRARRLDTATPTAAAPPRRRARPIPRRRRPCPTASRARLRRRRTARSRIGSISTLRPPWPPTPRPRTRRARTARRSIASHGSAPIAFLTSAPNRSASQPVAKSTIAASPFCDSSAPNLPPTSISAERRAGHIGEQRGGACAARLLEHQIVVAQLQRIARELERDVVVAAERELGERVELALRQCGTELDLARPRARRSTT